jgi:hypothetical protein
MAIGNTYEAIATQTLSSTSQSITFSSIPSTYTDLVFLTSIRFNINTSPFLRLNSDSGTNYSQTLIYGFGSTANSGRETSQTYYYPNDYGYSTVTANTFGFNQLNFMNYSNTTTYKNILERASTTDTAASASNGATASVGLWRSTNAINSINLFVGGSTYFQIGSTFSLYGIKAA